MSFLSGCLTLNMVNSWCLVLLCCCAAPLAAAPTRSSYLPGTGEHKAPRPPGEKWISLLFVAICKVPTSPNSKRELILEPETRTVLCSFDRCSFMVKAIFSVKLVQFVVCHCRRFPLDIENLCQILNVVFKLNSVSE